MNYIKKFAAFLLLAVLIAVTSACDFGYNGGGGGGGGTVQINGAVNLKVPYKYSDYDFLAGISATGTNVTLTVDASAINFNKLGTYEITYGIQGTSITQKVNVEVVLGTQQSIAENDIALLERLRGDVTIVEKGLIYTVAALRAENYNIVLTSDIFYSDGIQDLEEIIEYLFVKELSEMETELVELYLNMWFDAFADETNEEISDGDKIKIYYSFLLGRSFTEAEEEIIDGIADIADRFEDLGTSDTFIIVDKDELIDELQLNDVEIAAYDSFESIRNEFLGKDFLLMLDSTEGVELNNDNINAVLLLTEVLYANQGFSLSVELAEQQWGEPFNDEQIEAYNILLDLYRVYLVNTNLEDIRDVWDRDDITDTDKAHLINCILIIESEYRNESNSFLDAFGEFSESTVSQIQTKTELSDSQIESIFYIKTQILIAFLKNELGINLDNDELEAVPVIVRIWDEYDSNKEETDPEMPETENNDEIIDVIDRDLSVEEIAALEYFRSIIDEINSQTD